MDAASLLCSRGLMAQLETGAALFFQCISMFVILLIPCCTCFRQVSFLEQNAKMFIASILFVIVYQQGLNPRPVVSLGCD